MAKGRLWAALGGLALAWWYLSAHPPKATAAAPGRPLVVLDPGHGGPDPGAVGVTGLLEKEVNLEIAQSAARTLMGRGVGVAMTRTQDSAARPGPYLVVQDLRERAFLARRVGATILVSIHSNAEPTGTVAGPIVYYRADSPSSQQLAWALTGPLASTVGIYHPPRPAHHLVLMEARVPAVTVEVGFLTQRHDLARLTSSAWRQRLGTAVAQGILAYLGRR